MFYEYCDIFLLHYVMVFFQAVVNYILNGLNIKSFKNEFFRVNVIIESYDLIRYNYMLSITIIIHEI